MGEKGGRLKGEEDVPHHRRLQHVHCDNLAIIVSSKHPQFQDAKEVCAGLLQDGTVVGEMCAQCEDGCERYNLSSICNAYKFGYVFDNPGTIFFAFIMSLWASVFLDFWKRRNNTVRGKRRR